MMGKYAYLAGLSQLAERVKAKYGDHTVDQFLDIVHIHDVQSDNCDYCNAAIRYKAFVRLDPEIGIGLCCLDKLWGYLGLPDYRFKAVVAQYKRYLALCKKARVSPEAKVAVRDLDAQMDKVRKLVQELRELKWKELAEFNTYQASLRPRFNKMIETAFPLLPPNLQDLAKVVMAGNGKPYEVKHVNNYVVWVMANPSRVIPTTQKVAYLRFYDHPLKGYSGKYVLESSDKTEGVLGCFQDERELRQFATVKGYVVQ